MNVNWGKNKATHTQTKNPIYLNKNVTDKIQCT